MTAVKDVCLLLEGTYPFVAGGVSTWLHNLIRGLPEVSFTAVCILPTSEEEWPYRYQVPGNFGDIEVIYLHDKPGDTAGSVPFPKILGRRTNLLRKLHKDMCDWDYDSLAPVLAEFRKGNMPLKELLHGRAGWDVLTELYQSRSPQESFLDYFWTYRFTHLPIFKVLTAHIPRARVYHAISTGYAGLLGVMARLLHQRPLLLTEHGIYTKERKIEISQSEWIFTTGEKTRLQKSLGAFHRFWIRIFESLGRLTYAHCERIYTLYDGNRQLEVAEGADPSKIEIIPNGIDLTRFAGLHPACRADPSSLTMGFVGRVVPIKDVKTFLRAVKIVSLRVKNLKAYVMGPTEEDPGYYEECLELTRLLELEGKVVYTGRVNVLEYYTFLDLIVLTSISEAQPLVILEANCAGVPVVAGDVGACRELLEGLTPEDRALGPSGLVTNVADPMDTAQAILKLHLEAGLWERMSEAGRMRVASFYREEDLNRKYLGIYRNYMARQDLAEV